MLDRLRRLGPRRDPRPRVPRRRRDVDPRLRARPGRGPGARHALRRRLAGLRRAEGAPRARGEAPAPPTRTSPSGRAEAKPKAEERPHVRRAPRARGDPRPHRRRREAASPTRGQARATRTLYAKRGGEVAGLQAELAAAKAAAAKLVARWEDARAEEGVARGRARRGTARAGEVGRRCLVTATLNRCRPNSRPTSPRRWAMALRGVLAVISGSSCSQPEHRGLRIGDRVRHLRVRRRNPRLVRRTARARRPW